MPDDNKAAADAAKDAEAARARASKDRDATIKDTRKRVEEETEEAEKRQRAKPTPTQDENDRAKLGLNSLEELDDKEPDGSPEETPATRAAAYNTRDTAPKR